MSSGSVRLQAQHAIMHDDQLIQEIKRQDCRARIDLAPAAPTNRSLSEPRSSAGPTSPEQMPFGVISIGYDRMPRVEHPWSATNFPVRKFILGLS